MGPRSTAQHRDVYLALSEGKPFIFTLEKAFGSIKQDLYHPG